MIAPERWYEYQKDYQKYGIDMKPKPEPGTRTGRRRSTRKGNSSHREREEGGLFGSTGYGNSHDSADNNNGLCGKSEI